MGSEDSTDSSVSAQKEKGTKFGSLLKGAFGSMAKAVKGPKTEKKFFGREKVKDDYIESLECINGIHSNSDPELPDITKRNVMPGRFAKVEAPKIRTEIRPKTFEVMDEVPADDTEDEDLEIFEDIEEEPVKVPEFVEPVVHVTAEPVAEPVMFVRETEESHVQETGTEEEDECEVDYFDFLPPMKATERAPVRRVPQSRPVVDLDECDDAEEIEAESEEAEEEEEEHVRTKEEVFIDLFDDAPEEPAVKAEIQDEPACAADADEPVVTVDVDNEPLCREIDLDILDVPVVAEVQELEVIVERKTEIETEIEIETVFEEASIEEEIVIEKAIEKEIEIEIHGTTKEEMFIDLFDNVDETPVRAEIDLDILDVPAASVIQEGPIAAEDEDPITISEVHVPADIPVVQEAQRAAPEVAIPAYGRSLSIDFDAFDRAAESPLDARFDVEEVEHVHVPQDDVSFDITSLESVSIPTVSEEAVEVTEVQISPINVEIDFTGLETPVSPINVEIDFTGLETPVSPINVEIDFTGLETPVSPINVEIDMISLTSVRTVIEVPVEDHAAYVPNFILVNDEDVVEIKTESELSAMMPETVLRTFDSEHEFLEIDAFDVTDDTVAEAPMDVPEQEIRVSAEVPEGSVMVQEPVLSDLMPETMLKAFDSEHEFLEIDVLDVAEESSDLEIDESDVMEFLEIDESEITEVTEASEPNYLEIDVSEIMEFLEIEESEVKEFLEIEESEVKEFLEIDESEITEIPEVSVNYLEIDESEVKEFLEIDESEITEIPEVSARPVREAKVFARTEGTEEKGGIFFSFFSKEDKEDSISISFGESKEDDDVMDDSGESVSVRDDYAVTVSSTDGSRKLFI